MARVMPTFMVVAMAALLASCIQLRAPKDPIEINLNVKIDQEVRVRLDDDVNELITDNPDLF